MKQLFFLLIEIFLLFHMILANPLKDNLWYTAYDEAWQRARVQDKPLYLLVASEALDPYQLSLFERLSIREILQEGFVPLILSPYEEVAFKLPIKTLPATFVISAKGEALLSYQGLLWEADFFKLVLPLASLTKSALIDFKRQESLNTYRYEQMKSYQGIKEKDLLKHTLSFEQGYFRFNGRQWILKYKNKERKLKEPSWGVLDYLLLEDEAKEVIYALPLLNKNMSYQMDKKTEIWKPFYLIEQK